MRYDIYLNTYGQIILLDALIIQGMIDLDICPGVAIVRPLLQIERVKFVGLCRGAGHQTIENGRIPFNTGTVTQYTSANWLYKRIVYGTN